MGTMLKGHLAYYTGTILSLITQYIAIHFNNCLRISTGHILPQGGTRVAVYPIQVSKGGGGKSHGHHTLLLHLCLMSLFPAPILTLQTCISAI